MALEVVYSPLLVAGSLAAACMASFTALRLTSNLHGMSAYRRKVRVTEGALALGVGIWCMHFIGMLAVKLPVQLSFEPLQTVGSALIAVLVTGIAFLSLHFGRRGHARIWVAGIVTGLGIVSMHYLGMNAISNCIASYDPTGVVIAAAVGIGASVVAFELAYRWRDLPGVIGGAVILGLAISGMHYSAMLFTSFTPSSDLQLVGAPLLESDQLALIVVLISFFISGLFLLLAIPDDEAAEAVDSPAAAVPASSMRQPAANPAPMPAEAGEAALAGGERRIPYERNKAMRLLPPETILAVRAEGHYTKLMTDTEELFCPWSISRVARTLDGRDFLRVHRSNIVNRHRISGLRRDGESTFCILGDEKNLEVPVSRSHLPQLREILHLEV